MLRPRHFAPALLLGLACLGPSLRAADPAPATSEETLTLPKFEVNGHAICSFGIGVVALVDNQTKAIVRLMITEVTPNSLAERLGLKRGDEILTINGRKIADMKGGMKKGGDLFNLLVDQRPDTIVDLEVAVRSMRRLSLKALP